MLVLTRMSGEGLLIGDVKVVLKVIGQHKIKVIIDAPKEIKILRSEILKRRTGCP